jgi:hypothetical protein
MIVINYVHPSVFPLVSARVFVSFHLYFFLAYNLDSLGARP